MLVGFWGLILRLPFLISACLVALALLLFCWFTPWVFTLNMGFLLYFPYEPQGAGRYLRVVGPLATNLRLGSEPWLPTEKIPEGCKRALVAAEDSRFYSHAGIDFESLQENLERNQRLGRHSRGGSTITQQIVKNAFLSRDKTYVRKVREMFGALILDLFMSKSNQLGWYFNIVEFGPNIYGLRAAAKHYFKKDPEKLSLQQCVKLVAILPAPNKWNASLVRGYSSPFFARRVQTISARMAHIKQPEEEASGVAANGYYKKSQVGKPRASGVSAIVQGDSLVRTQLLNEDAGHGEEESSELKVQADLQAVQGVEQAEEELTDEAKAEVEFGAGAEPQVGPEGEPAEEEDSAADVNSVAE